MTIGPPFNFDSLLGWDVGTVDAGIMLHCRRCGIHDWREGTERTLIELIGLALAHRDGDSCDR